MHPREPTLVNNNETHASDETLFALPHHHQVVVDPFLCRCGRVLREKLGRVDNVLAQLAEEEAPKVDSGKCVRGTCSRVNDKTNTTGLKRKVLELKNETITSTPESHQSQRRSKFNPNGLCSLESVINGTPYDLHIDRHIQD